LDDYEKTVAEFDPGRFFLMDIRIITQCHKDSDVVSENFELHEALSK